MIEDFSKGWCFHLGEVEEGRKQNLADDGWESVTLPHSWNACDTFVPSRGYYRGPGWYRKRFDVPAFGVGKKVFIEFGAGFALADVWVNEQHVGQYMGGFTGFEVDASPWVRATDNVIALRLDNSHDPEILPGREIPDYNLYGGLYREATLRIKDALHIPWNGLTVTTPQVTKEAASVHVCVKLKNDRDEPAACTCAVEILDPEGVCVTSADQAVTVAGNEEAEATFLLDDIASPFLWSPDTPQLYEARVQVSMDERPLEERTVRFGFRWFEFTVEDGFHLNGERLELRGVNRHQDYPGLANAVPPRLQKRDAAIIKDLGGNFVRTSHYPQHPAFLDACDELGVLVYAEIASWQHIGGAQFFENAKAMMREMIARDKNHPSIILWGLLNEGRSRGLFEQLNDVAHGCDPTRPTVYADNRPEEGKELGTVFVPDVLGINYKTPHLVEIREMLPELKVLSSEHTNADHAERGKLDTELAQIDKLKDSLDRIEAQRFMAGSALWSMHDYGTDYEPVWPIQHSGILDAYRLPKEAYQSLKIRWARERMIHICGHWTWPGHEGKQRTVTVLTNCDTIELYVNGRSLGIRRGENPSLWDVEYEPGTLTAIGRDVGDAVGPEISAALTTARAADALVLEVSDDRLLANGADCTEVTVRVVDKFGVVVPQAREEAVFSVDGPAHIRGIGGEPKTQLAAGVGRIIVQATDTPGDVTITAAYEALIEAVVTLTTLPVD